MPPSVLVLALEDALLWPYCLHLIMNLSPSAEHTCLFQISFWFLLTFSQCEIVWLLQLIWHFFMPSFLQGRFQYSHRHDWVYTVTL